MQAALDKFPHEKQMSLGFSDLVFQVYTGMKAGGVGGSSVPLASGMTMDSGA